MDGLLRVIIQRQGGEISGQGFIQSQSVLIVEDTYILGECFIEDGGSF